MPLPSDPREAERREESRGENLFVDLYNCCPDSQMEGIAGWEEVMGRSSTGQSVRVHWSQKKKKEEGETLIRAGSMLRPNLNTNYIKLEETVGPT